VDECKPLMAGSERKAMYEHVRHDHVQPPGTGLHSSTLQLNLSALYAIGGAPQGLCSPC